MSRPMLTLCNNDDCRSAKICLRHEAERMPDQTMRQFKPVANTSRCREFIKLPKGTIGGA